MSWTVDASGTQSSTANGVEYTLDSPTTNATYMMKVDLSNLSNGDVVELRVYDKVDGTNYRQEWLGVFANIPINTSAPSPFVVIVTQGKFTLKQTAGTGRSYPWEVVRQ